MRSNVKLVVWLAAGVAVVAVAAVLVAATFLGASATALPSASLSFGPLPTPGTFVTAATDIRMQVAAEAQQVDAATAAGYMPSGSFAPLHDAAKSMVATTKAAIGQLESLRTDASQTVEKTQMVDALHTIEAAAAAEEHATSPQQVLGDIQMFDSGIMALGGAPAAP